MKRALSGVVASWLAVAVASGCASLSGLTPGGAGDAGEDDAGHHESDTDGGHDARATSHKESGAVDADEDATGSHHPSDAESDSSTGCVIAGKSFASGAANPTNACEACQTDVATSAWSNLADGTVCGTGGICYAGGCVSGCEIGGVYYSINAPNPNDLCQTCQPGKSTSTWNAIADGTNCGNGQICSSGQCGTQCDVEGTVYSSGTVDTANTCESCQPGTSTSTWTDVSDGTGCASGEVCTTGACGAGCFIGGVVYAPMAPNSNNACQLCQPGTSTTTWSSVTNGTSCGNDQICGNGECGTQCSIGGTVVASGASNPSNACQLCQPGASTSVWTSTTDGTPCGTGEVCSVAVCSPGCFIASTFYPPSTMNTANACESCQPATSTTAWSGLPDGMSCASHEVCNAAVCVSDCFIGGAIYASSAKDPSNGCLSCQPVTSTTAWKDVVNGTSCGSDGQECTGGTCLSGSGSGSGSSSGTGSGSS